MQDTMARTAAVRVLASAPAWKVPVVAMATPVDPILTAIAIDRVAYVAFAASLNRTDGRNAAIRLKSSDDGHLAGAKLWLWIGSVAGPNVCCNFDDFGRIFAAEFLGRLIGEFL